MKDVTLELDGLSRNRIVSDAMAMVQQIYILLNMAPGDCADLPEKGIDLQNYRVGWADEKGLELKSAIETQIQEYSDFVTSDVEVLFNNGQLLVGITSPSFDDLIVFSTTEDNSILASIIES